ncbi:MAG: hypothetical protein HYY40_04985 [Bacteroidetes bacterium]|nr:hypothetical protein [Bacteroidota bacterium]
MNWLKVPVLNKEGKDEGNYLLQLSKVLYFRGWKIEDRIVSVAYLEGGHAIVFNVPYSDLDDFIRKSVFSF